MADDAGIEWIGVNAFLAYLDNLIAAADDGSREIIAIGSTQRVAESQRNFVGSHAPGEPHVGGSFPNVVSGELRRGITADPITQFGAADYGTTVAPRMIYGRRVELGFNGSPGYPYFGPAVDVVAPAFAQLAQDTWAAHIARAR